MRYALFLVSVLAVAGLVLLQGGPAEASFHCTRIYAVMAGFNGNNNIQYVELRERIGGQNMVGGHKIRFYDASNTLKATFTFPSGATNNLAGDSTLIGTSEFNTNTNGGDADFTFSGNTVASNGGDPLHPIQSPGGKIVWAGEPTDLSCAGGLPPSDSVAYGSFSGPIDFNSSGMGTAPALPNPSDNRALRVSNLGTPTDNHSEYSLAAVATSPSTVLPANLISDTNTPRNNGRMVLQIQSSVGGIAELPGINSSAAQNRAQQPAPSSDGGWLYAEVSAAIVAGTLVLGSGAWYARRQRARRRV